MNQFKLSSSTFGKQFKLLLPVLMFLKQIDIDENAGFFFFSFVGGGRRNIGSVKLQIKYIKYKPINLQKENINQR